MGSRQYKRARQSHGMCGTPEYRLWRNVKDRCELPTSTGYPWYGAKGITMCEQWASNVLIFLRDIGPKPGPEYSLDRIDSKGNYEPGNVKWSTKVEQSQNAKSNVNVTINGETFCVYEWCRRLGVSNDTVFARIYSGWSPERALLQPINKKYANKKEKLAYE